MVSPPFAPPVFGASASGQSNGAVASGFGPTLYVNTINGATLGNAKSPKNAASTFAQAFDILANMEALKTKSADDAVIYWLGDVREQLTAPLGVSGVTIKCVIGGMNRHDNGGRWRVPATTSAGTALLELREQGWCIDGGLFVPDTTGGAAIKAHRNEDATYPDSSHFVVQNARIVGGGGTPIGVEDVGGNFDYLITNCIFQSLTKAITCSSTSIAVPLQDRIIGNTFRGNTNDVASSFSYGLITNNYFMTAGSGATNKVVSTTYNSVQGGNSQILLNQFSNTEAQIAPGNGFTGAATDTWMNYVNDQAALAYGQPA